MCRATSETEVASCDTRDGEPVACRKPGADGARTAEEFLRGCRTPRQRPPAPPSGLTIGHPSVPERRQHRRIQWPRAQPHVDPCRGTDACVRFNLVPQSWIKDPRPLFRRQFVEQDPTVQGLVEVAGLLRRQVPLLGSAKHLEVIPETTPSPAIWVVARHVAPLPFFTVRSHNERFRL